MMGFVIGSSGMAGSLGMALGPMLGGWIYDAYATYFWLYVRPCEWRRNSPTYDN